jgi:hypothetical protein
MKDRLWFYTAHRWWGNQAYAIGNYFNAMPHTLFYTPDLSRPAFTDIHNEDHTGRLTFQAGAKHKINVSYGGQSNCYCYFQVDANRAPDATDNESYKPVSLTQATWSFPATNRLLFQAGLTFGQNHECHCRVDGANSTDISVTELSTGYIYGAKAGLSVVDYQLTKANQVNGRVSVSYVTGTHAFKAGLAFLEGWYSTALALNNPPISYSFRNQLPASITEYASPNYNAATVNAPSLYAQDQWTLKKVTLNLGVRYDYLHAWNPAQPGFPI